MHGLPDFAAARILVAGDVMLDRYWSGPTSRISPEAPVPVVKIEGAEARPGAAANVALNLAALGVRATLLGVVGRDDPGRILRENLARAGIHSEWIESPNRPTITKLRVLSRNQQVLRLDFEEPLSGPEAFPRAALLQRFRALLGDADAVILSDYDKGTLADAPDFIAAAREAGKAVLIDPKGRDYSRYRGATLLTPNVSELEAVVGACDDDVQLLERGAALLQALNLAALLITRSEKGMTLLRRNGLPVHLPAEAREVFDVTGAGDTVIATLAAALAAGETLERSMRLANLAAGIVVGKLGTAAVSRTELARALAGDTPPGGVLDEDALVAAVAAAKAGGRRVVMTNGCFDLLHAGHVRYLEAAKALGDLLVVAVNDDESVRRLKGPKRPLNPITDRMALLAALKAVDWVVPFAEDTPARLIARVLPDTLVKGGDYRPEQIAGFEAVTAAGGRVQVLDFHKNYSTTALIERARGG